MVSHGFQVVRFQDFATIHTRFRSRAPGAVQSARGPGKDLLEERPDGGALPFSFFRGWVQGGSNEYGSK